MTTYLKIYCFSLSALHDHNLANILYYTGNAIGPCKNRFCTSYVLIIQVSWTV